ncbi:MAG: hypothetical protein GX295_01045 [Syntrophomonadaceae bacterium]|nr:hypothetical protein [Syntrophomonadaceae bacterium]
MKKLEAMEEVEPIPSLGPFRSQRHNCILCRQAIGETTTEIRLRQAQIPVCQRCRYL